jgi:hypothetical protein
MIFLLIVAFLSSLKNKNKTFKIRIFKEEQKGGVRRSKKNLKRAEIVIQLSTKSGHKLL